MEKTLRVRVLNSDSDSRKSKACPEPRRRIDNLIWPGFSVIAFVLVVLVAVAHAQQPTKIPRIGYLTGATPDGQSARIEPFRQGLRKLGYVEGKSIIIEYRYAEGKLDRLPSLAAEVVRLKVDMIVTGGAIITRAAKVATVTIPIVMTQDSDPVGDGFVSSLARPGGNITGLSNFAPEIGGKQLELLREIVPRLSRVAVFGTGISTSRATHKGYERSSVPQRLSE